jgi:poly-D-alanine transfer protein DltD
MDPIIIIVVFVLILLFVPISLASVLFSKQDCDDSRVILPK